MGRRPVVIEIMPGPEYKAWGLFSGGEGPEFTLE